MSDNVLNKYEVALLYIAANDPQGSSILEAAFQEALAELAKAGLVVNDNHAGLGYTVTPAGLAYLKSSRNAT
jgi:hypothetical protein